MPDNSDSDY